MVTATVTSTHTHNYLIGADGKGRCKCGQLVKFNQMDNDMKKWTKDVLVAGDPNYMDSMTSVVKTAEKLLNVADPPAAPAVKAANNHKKHSYYQDHKAEILKDIATLGRPAAEKKWHIASGTMSGLKKIWELEWPVKESRKPSKKASAKVSQNVPGETKEPKNIPAINHDLPPFPVFSNDWDLELQLRWLDIWKELRSREN